MKIFQFNKGILIAGILLMVTGVVLTLVSLSILGFDFTDLANHFGTWYSPMTW